MKNNFKLVVAFLLLYVGVSYAQSGDVGIGTINPDPSAALDITSTTKGLLMPRMTTVERNLIATPAKGLTIFNTTINAQETNTGTSAAPVWSAQGVDAGWVKETAYTSLLQNKKNAYLVESDTLIKVSLNGGFLFHHTGNTNNGITHRFVGKKNNVSGGWNVVASTGTNTLGYFLTERDVTDGSFAYNYLRPTQNMEAGVLGFDINHKAVSTTKVGKRLGILTGYIGSAVGSGDTEYSGNIGFKVPSITQNIYGANAVTELITIAGQHQNVGFNNNTPNASALVDISSTTKGFLPPRMTSEQYNSISSPAEGLVVYCLNCSPKGLRVFDGVNWTDMAGNAGPNLISAPVLTVAPTSFTLGTPVTFSATTGNWINAISYTYQWYFNGVAISGETNATYAITSVSAGDYYCTVTGVNNVGGGPVTPSNTYSVSSTVPSNSLAPVISQTSVEFTSTSGTWANTSSFSYQWKKDGIAIAGATSSSYTIQVADYNTSITCDVTGVNNIGSTTTSSNAITHMIGSGSGAAYSLRKVTPNATLAIKVRRSSDNTTLDVGFIGSDLDTAALTTFVGTGDGFIETWYDQSPNSRNITQATAANQPQIASAGTIFVRNGKPVVRFNGSSNVLFNTTPWMYDNGSVMVLAVLIGNTVAQTGLLSETSTVTNGANYTPIATGPSNALTVFARGDSSSAITFQNIQTGVFNNIYKSISIQDNGTSFIATNGGTVSTPFIYSRPTNIAVMPVRNRFSMGAWVRGTTGFYWLGDISEMIIHSSVLPDSLRDGIKANATTYYGL